MDYKRAGFTLIELLVAISVIGILIGISVFGLQGARESSRDAKRKADIEQVRSALELYRADCNVYPVPLPVAGASLKGSSPTGACLSSNTYLAVMPTDPVAGNVYRSSSTATTYEICAALENGTGSVVCGGSSNCGGKTCNYRVTNP